MFLPGLFEHSCTKTIKFFFTGPDAPGELEPVWLDSISSVVPCCRLDKRVKVVVTVKPSAGCPDPAAATETPSAGGSGLEEEA